MGSIVNSELKVSETNTNSEVEVTNGLELFTTTTTAAGLELFKEVDYPLAASEVLTRASDLRGLMSFGAEVSSLMQHTIYEMDFTTVLAKVVVLCDSKSQVIEGMYLDSSNNIVHLRVSPTGEALLSIDKLNSNLAWEYNEAVSILKGPSALKGQSYYIGYIGEDAGVNPVEGVIATDSF